ncbi:TIGR02678 family protein [Tannockella kyphosi]|uniref:TIGR02678 family protein n=1 Tax=Tannockella kyphosi TaxID=2899121 RepID=UPI0020111AAA|nr:TIGR02678 family protein [Tannockella kyphosi]
MKTIEELLNRRWVLKKDNTELYYQIKDDSKEIRQKVYEKIGYNLIITQNLIKLEKIPGKGEGWMGIQEFQTNTEYQMFCYLLMYLEDKEIEEQFALLDISEYIKTQFQNNQIDWETHKNRRQFIHVIKFALKNGLLILNDGDEEGFLKDEKANALYENTGNSRYFMRHFTTDIMDYQKSEDFLYGQWIGIEENRGIVRRQRVYRKLLLSLGIYRYSTSDEEDFQYVRNYRNQIEKDFQKLFPCTLQVHSSSAYLVIDEDAILKKTIPGVGTMNDLCLIVNENIRKLIKNNKWIKNEHEIVSIQKTEYDLAIQKILKTNIEKLPKKYQIVGIENLTKQVIEYQENVGFILLEEQMVVIFPIVAKIVGSF